ncbi:NAD(P)/FAD-dependent oxidoreductase [Bradyrhizobium yuanmingense]|uniref:NAD(P)/FAD-dependent oxidoreductase n=1 Tax=Bradyrhizobium yuanmingense TaxID=108015 RepID=UPI0004BC078F|nr:FAD-dependent oxidoreductase [Bradyrhizobium yuanmingense]
MSNHVEATGSSNADPASHFGATKVTPRSVVIVGAGHAGFQVAVSLRQEGFDGHIALVNDGPVLPYQRPPLSKSYLLGQRGVSSLLFRPERYYSDNKIELINDTRVVAIDRECRRVLLASGSHLNFDHLVLAVGLQNRTLPIPGVELQGVFGLRTIADADAIRAAMSKANDVVVVGAGFIGLEFAAAASAMGKSVRVFELLDRVMARAVTPEISRVFAEAHLSWGVKIEFGQGLLRVEGKGGRVVGVETTSASRHKADMVVFGLGATPHVSLARESGLEVENGIKVNAELLTSDPMISAIGDCASFPTALSGSHVRLESVQNATDQARAVAKRLTGKSGRYVALPWFWSDQRDLKLQIAGLSTGFDRNVVIGSPADQEMSVLSFKHDKLIGVQSINRSADHVAARKLLSRGIPTLNPAEANRDGFDLKELEATTR